MCTADSAADTHTDPDHDAHDRATYGDAHRHPGTDKYTHCYGGSTHTDPPPAIPISHHDGDCGSGGGSRHSG